MNRILILILALPGFLQAQNLVPNGDFEDTTNCSSFGWYLLSLPWYSPNMATPDYYYGLTPTCGFSAFAKSFRLSIAAFRKCLRRWLSLWRHTREYIQCQLSSPLLAGKQYYVGAFFNRANQFDQATDDLGLHLSTIAITDSSSNHLAVIPQIENIQGNLLYDSLNWIEVSGIYTALGGEAYLTVGNFKDSANTTLVDVDITPFHSAYIYIDDVFIYEFDSTQSINEFTPIYSIGPNPVSNYIFIQQSFNHQFIVEIFNRLGQRIYIDKNALRLDISDFSAGFYLLRISTDGAYSEFPFIKL
jgi:hypothetical protein